MRRRDWSDDQLVSSIMEGGKKRKDALAEIYLNSSSKTRIINFVRHKGVSEKIASEIYVESILVMDRNIRSGKFKRDSSIYTYLFSIAKYTWLNFKRSQEKIPATVEYGVDAEGFSDLQNPELSFIEDELKTQLNRLIEQLSEKCKTILALWSNNVSYNEIAETLGVKSNGSLRKQKLLCMNKLREHLLAHPELIPNYYNGRTGKT